MVQERLQTPLTSDPTLQPFLHDPVCPGDNVWHLVSQRVLSGAIDGHVGCEGDVSDDLSPVDGVTEHIVHDVVVGLLNVGAV